MKKRGSFAFLKVVIIFIIATLWIGLILYEQLPSILKPEIATEITTLYETYPNVLDMLFVIRAILISLIPITILLIFLRIFVFGSKNELKGINLNEIKLKSKTDLDALYAIIQIKKELKINSIAKLFKIDKELAMEWCKILESGELATIEYPGLGSPVLKITDEVEEEEVEEVEENKNKEFKEKEGMIIEEKKPQILKRNLKKIKREVRKIEGKENKERKKASKRKKKEVKNLKREIKRKDKKTRKKRK